MCCKLQCIVLCLNVNFVVDIKIQQSSEYRMSKIQIHLKIGQLAAGVTGCPVFIMVWRCK